LDVVQLQQDSTFTASSLFISKPVLTVFRDKQPPVSPVRRIKPVPVERIINLSFPVSLQSISLEDGTILYSEKTADSRKQADVLFTQIHGSIDNIRNTGLSDDDSLSFTLQGKFLDSALLSLQLKQSYTDSLSGFLLTGSLQPATISLINPVLIPLTDAKVLSGQLDTGFFRVTGSKAFALGEMNLVYHNLRVRLVKDGDPDKTTFMQHLQGFMANTFVLKRNNTKRKGVMYHKPSGRSSFINYILKVTLSGVTSSIGLKKNRKLMKQYRKAL
jgi:hypothetical protein